VSRRSHEIGLRVLLGATLADVWGLVLWQGGKLSAAGIALGVPLTIVGSNLFSSFLLDVDSTDPTTYLVVTTLLLATTVAASLLPGRRAATADPLEALRNV
jgi:ABC-type lipoprotein release transport system permease subunit